MLHRCLNDCVLDLQRAGMLVRWDEEIDPYLEAAEIQRRLYFSRGPAVLFTRVKDCRFPILANLFGTIERANYLFRDTLENVRRAIELKIDPTRLMRNPLRYWQAPLTAWRMRPRRVRWQRSQFEEITLADLPQVVSWPDDGGAFITLPQVYTEQPGSPGFERSNLGMYRVQLSGNEYVKNREVGLHYQIHRGIGVHHQAAIARGEPLRVSIFVGGTPAMTLSAVMPLPEGLSELTFAGALAGGRIPMACGPDHPPIYADADFCILGTIHPGELKPEGPFGDHLGYYSLQHPFPVMRVEKVLARRGAIWPFTVVGRPPQEDTTFGELIHEITGPIIPTVLPGVHAVHAVDAAGVHPLLLAIGSERYMPFQASRPEPQELLTQANAILGQGQMSLAKYLMIVNRFDDPSLDIHDIRSFLRHWLERIDWRRDLHFQTRTTIDTLDYSGHGFNQGSKVVMAAVGPALRTLPSELGAMSLPEGFRDPRVCLPGVLAIGGPTFTVERGRSDVARFVGHFSPDAPLNRFPLIVLVDDADDASRSLNNFLWTTFTRSNPAVDIDGVGAFTEEKHWGCRGSLVIDARRKTHHAPPVVEDSRITQRVDALAARGGPLAPYL